jgi:hypothetical protein
MSLVTNHIQINSQVKNLKYYRRFSAEVSDGIGSWVTCLDTLSQISIFLNCATIYFTSKVYVQIFVGSEQGDVPVEELNDFETITNGWDITTFLILLIMVEHGMLMIKIVIEQLIEETPPEIVEGERERSAVIDNHEQKMKSCKHIFEEGKRTNEAVRNTTNTK